VRIWTEHSTRVLPTMDGPMQVVPGDVVVVAVVDDAEEARHVLERLESAKRTNRGRK